MPAKRIPKASKTIVFFYEEVTANHHQYNLFSHGLQGFYTARSGQSSGSDRLYLDIFFFNIYYLALYYILIVVDNITNLQDVEN